MSRASGFGEINQLVTEVFDSLAGASIERLVEAIVDLRKLSASIKIVGDDIESRVAGLLPRKKRGAPTAVISGRAVQVKPSTERKGWDHEGLIRVVVARGRDERRIDRETGEPLESEADAVVRALVECAGIRDWRTTALKARGIDPDEFCSKSYGPDRVIV